MVFSTNQNRQLYVATTDVTYTPTNIGQVTVKTDPNGHKYLIQKGYGGLVRSDIINPDTIMWATASSPKDTEIKLKAFKLTLDADVNQGQPISGQDYIVRINFRQMYGMSDEDIYQKYGAVHAVASMTDNVSKFYAELAYSLVKNFSRLYAPLIDIIIDGKAVARAAKYNGEIGLFDSEGGTITPNSDGIIFQEKSQVSEWALGTKQYTPVYFEVIPTTVVDADGNDVTWGKVAPVDSVADPVPNGYKYADLEYFCMGERGDQYRNVGWPKSIPTKYMVDPTASYYCLDIHYAYQGTCEDIQKSEKTLTIISAKDIKEISLDGPKKAAANSPEPGRETIDAIIKDLGIEELVSYTDYYADDKNASDSGNQPPKQAKTVTGILASKATKEEALLGLSTQ